MTTKSSTTPEVTRTGFLKSEFSALKQQGDTQSFNFLAGSKALNKRTDVVRSKTVEKRHSGRWRLNKKTSYTDHALDPNLDESITDEAAQTAYEASRRREDEIRRRMAAPGRKGLFLPGV